MNTEKNIHAQELGRLGGRAGRGTSKARKTTTEQARKAANARWNRDLNKALPKHDNCDCSSCLPPTF